MLKLNVTLETFKHSSSFLSLPKTFSVDFPALFYLINSFRLSGKVCLELQPSRPTTTHPSCAIFQSELVGKGMFSPSRKYCGEIHSDVKGDFVADKKLLGETRGTRLYCWFSVEWIYQNGQRV